MMPVLYLGFVSFMQKKGSKLKKASSLEEGEDDLDYQGNLARGAVHYSRLVTRNPGHLMLYRGVYTSVASLEAITM